MSAYKHPNDNMDLSARRDHATYTLIVVTTLIAIGFITAIFLGLSK